MVNTILSKIKQFKNLILLVTMIFIVLLCLCTDPLGYYAERTKYRAQIMNDIAIARAEAEKKIALIKAETEAELLRIKAIGTDGKNINSR